MKGLMFGLGLALLIGLTGRVLGADENPAGRLMIDGLADGLVRVTTPEGLVIEVERMSLWRPAGAAEGRRVRAVVEGGPGDEVTMILSGPQGERRFKARRFALNTETLEMWALGGSLVVEEPRVGDREVKP